MNIKRIFGTFLTILGVVGLVMAAIQFVNNSAGAHNVRVLVTFAILGLVFFISGLGLVRTIKDES
jgi:uncharacterized membrane protein